MSLTQILMDIVWWPGCVMKNISAQPPQYIPVIVGLGASLYLLGVPDLSSDAMTLATQWVEAGCIYKAADLALSYA